MLEPCPTMADPKAGEFLSPLDSMKWALILARRGAGFVSPNPMVGCVIVDSQHRFVVGGWHHQVGHDHAEVDALREFDLINGKDASLAGHYVYVTLEPCAHQGRTGSCAVALAARRPDSVVYGIQDPNPLVAGKGAEILRNAGIKAESLAEISQWPGPRGEKASDLDKSELISEIEDLTEIFLWGFRSALDKEPRPFVTIKVASTIDGRVAMNNGASQWITSELARKKSHRLRLEHDAILVGRKTIEVDDPSLNVRLSEVKDHVNSVIVIDPKARLAGRLDEFNIAKVRAAEKILLCVEKQKASSADVARARDQGFRVLEVETEENGLLNLHQALRDLRILGIQSIFIEGGAGTVGPFFNLGLVNRLHVFMALTVLGGQHAAGWSDFCGVKSLEEIWKLREPRIKRLGPDIHITGRLL